MATFRQTGKVSNAVSQSNLITVALMDALNITNVNISDSVKSVSDKIKNALGSGGGGEVTPTSIVDANGNLGEVVAGYDGNGKVKMDYATSYRPFVLAGYLITNTLPLNPKKGDVYIDAEPNNPLEFDIGGGTPGSAEDFAQNESCSAIQFDTSLSVEDVTTLLSGITNWTDMGEGQYVFPLLEDSNNVPLIMAIKQSMGEDNYAYGIMAGAGGSSMVWISIEVDEIGPGWVYSDMDEEGVLLLDETYVVGIPSSEINWNGVLASNYTPGTPGEILTLYYRDWLCYNGTGGWFKVDNQEYASQSYVNGLIGDINSILDDINGEVV